MYASFLTNGKVNSKLNHQLILSIFLYQLRINERYVDVELIKMSKIDISFYKYN
jgi:hypothetical protein